MTGGLRLARIFGTDLFLKFTALILAGLFARPLMQELESFPLRWTPLQAGAATAAAGALFLLTILLHELAHATAAKLYGCVVDSIVLHGTGGETRWRIELSRLRPAIEFWVAMAGPMTTLVIGILLVEAANRPPLAHPAARLQAASLIVRFLGRSNLLLGCFNMLPLGSMDGRRVLRAMIWALNGDMDRAARLARWLGILFSGVALIAALLAMYRGHLALPAPLQTALPNVSLRGFSRVAPSGATVFVQRHWVALLTIALSLQLARLRRHSRTSL